jgi:hypothetical protein
LAVIAHLTIQKGRFTWSGHNASGDPAHRPYAMIVDVGRDFTITSEGNLYLTGAGPLRFTELSVTGFVLAARCGWFGLKIVTEEEPAKAEKPKRSRKKA